MRVSKSWDDTNGLSQGIGINYVSNQQFIANRLEESAGSLYITQPFCCLIRKCPSQNRISRPVKATRLHTSQSNDGLAKFRRTHHESKTAKHEGRWLRWLIKLPDSEASSAGDTSLS